MKASKFALIRKHEFVVFILGAVVVANVQAAPGAIESWPEVVKAVEQVNLDGGGIIRLGTRSTLIVDRRLPLISSSIVIEGNGATLQAKRDYHGALIRVTAAGNLELEDLHITGFDRKILNPDADLLALIDNRGSLKLNRVTIANNPWCYPCSYALSILDNRGEAWLNNVTLFRNYTISRSFSTSVRNCGYMQILNSTFAKSEAYGLAGFAGVRTPEPAALLDSIGDLCGQGAFEIGNTLFDNVYSNCSDLGNLTDLGGNFDSDDSCGFDLARNAVNGESGLSRFGLHGGLVPTVGLEPRSRAIDIGMNENCSAIDARLASRPSQTRINVSPRCDAGAFEYGGGFGNALLTGNGLDGIWYNAATDGHYLHVLRVSPNRVYVNWSTFDRHGDQLWIFAVATTTESTSFSATAYISTDAVLVPGGAPEGHVVREWGEIGLELEDCTNGLFSYRANDAGFGEGQFELSRLAFAEGVGCQETDDLD